MIRVCVMNLDATDTDSDSGMITVEYELENGIEVLVVQIK
jgi:hypothetical protein